MPEHIHLRISESAKGTPSTIMQVLKQRVSLRLRRKPLTPTRQLRLRFQTSDHLLPMFWQPRFYDFNVCGVGRSSSCQSMARTQPDSLARPAK
jgi:REP element-mobilizing transposase RayT